MCTSVIQAVRSFTQEMTNAVNTLLALSPTYDTNTAYILYLGYS